MALYSLFDHSSAPTLSFTDVGSDPNQNIGTVFMSSGAGSVTAAWIYIGNTNIGGGASTVSLFPYQPVGGSVPAAITTQTFTFQSTVGWQRIAFGTPAAITANSRYIIAYRAPAGNYAATANQFDTALVSGVLTAPAGGGNDNGRYRNDAVNSYPTNGSANNAWYGIDVEADVSNNMIPTANAGNDQTVNAGETVTLDGSGSTDADGTVVSYKWVQISGTQVSLSDSTAAQPFFVAPAMTGGLQVLIFSLTVTDNDGGVSTNSATVTIHVRQAPFRNIWQIITVGRTVNTSWYNAPVKTLINNAWTPVITHQNDTITHGEQLTTEITGTKGIGVAGVDLQNVDPNGFRISTNASWGLPPWIPNQPYVYNNNVSNHGGIVPAGGLTIDGFFVPAGTWVSQFQNYASSLNVMGDNGGADPSWPGIVFRGCRYRTAVTGAGFINDFNGGTPVDGKIWVLFCDMGGTGAQNSDYCEVALKVANASAVFYRNYISYVTTGIQPLSNNCILLENYIEKLTYYYGPNPPPGESTDKHLNGITLNGGQTCIRIERNKVIAQNPDDAGRTIAQTDCISFFQDFATFPGNGINDDSTSGYRVLNNYVGGTGYCFYAGQGAGTTAGSVQNMVMTGNKVATTWWPQGGSFGPITATPPWGSNGNVWSNNTWADGPNAGQII